MLEVKNYCIQKIKKKWKFEIYQRKIQYFDLNFKIKIFRL